MSVFKANMAKSKRIKNELEKLGLDFYCQAVIDRKMPIHQVVCREEVLIDSTDNFLESNPVIEKHLNERQQKIDRHYAEQAEAKAWANRPKANTVY